MHSCVYSGDGCEGVGIYGDVTLCISVVRDRLLHM